MDRVGSRAYYYFLMVCIGIAAGCVLAGILWCLLTLIDLVAR